MLTYRSESLTFSSWNLLHDAFPSELNPHHHFQALCATELVSGPAYQLPSIVKRLAKLDTSLLTFLCIRDFHLTFDDLLNLTKIPMLGGLVLHQMNHFNTPSITAKQYTNWGRAVLETGALQKLSVLVMYDFSLRTESLFLGLASFPTLHIVGIRKPHGKAHTRDAYGDFQVLTPSW
jgi:hypothetical protein